MTNHQERDDIMNYVLLVLQIDGPEEDAQALKEILTNLNVRTPRQMYSFQKETLKLHLNDKSISQVQYEMLRYFQGWMEFYVNQEGRNGKPSALPRTLDEWQANFDVEVYETFIHSGLYDVTSAPMATANNNDKSTSSGNNQPPREVITPADEESQKSDLSSNGSNSSSNSKKSKPKKRDHGKGIKPFMKTSMTEFPEFTGRHQDWKAFKRGVKAIMELHGMGHLLTVKSSSEVEDHKHTMNIDADYKAKVKQFHSVLSLRLAKGSASTWISKYEDEMDGVLAWRELSKYYSHGGNKEILITNTVNELTALQLRHDSNGGFQKYLANFEDKVRDLAQLDFNIPDPLKKTYFLQGIVDRDYETTKDMCEKLNYKDTVDTIRSKAIKLGKVDSKSQSHSNNRSTRRSDSNNSNYGNQRRGRRRYRDQDKGSNGRNRRRNNNRNTTPGRDSNGKKHNPGARFSDEVWAKMSDENKKWILAAKNQGQKQYGMQYSNDNSKKVTFNNKVNSYESQTNSDTDASPGTDANSNNSNQADGNNNKPPQSIFRRQRMMKTKDENKGGLQHPPASAYDESKPMDPIVYLKDPPGSSRWKDGFFVDSCTALMNKRPLRYEVLFRIIHSDQSQEYCITNAKWMQTYHPEAFAWFLIQEHEEAKYDTTNDIHPLMIWAYNYLNIPITPKPSRTVRHNMKRQSTADVISNAPAPVLFDMKEVIKHTPILDTSAFFKGISAIKSALGLDEPEVPHDDKSESTCDLPDLDARLCYDSSSDEDSYCSHDDDSTITIEFTSDEALTTSTSQDGPDEAPPPSQVRMGPLPPTQPLAPP
jgi:hypothetical protein